MRGQLEGSREQLAGARNVARGEFLLALDRNFSDFHDIALRLQNPKWTPMDSPEGFKLARYMGAVERIGLLVRDGILDLSTVETAYGWRIQWLVRNDTTRKRLLTMPQAWPELNRLWRELDAVRQAAGDPCLCPGSSPPPDALCR